jgi:hypothetical protein
VVSVVRVFQTGSNKEKGEELGTRGRFFPPRGVIIPGYGASKAHRSGFPVSLGRGLRQGIG